MSDGIIFISIDEHEVGHLRLMMDDDKNYRRIEDNAFVWSAATKGAKR